MEHLCPHCGAPLPADASFCPHCAQSVRTRRPAQVPAHLWRKRLKIAVLVLVLLAVAAGLLALFLRSSAPTGLPEGEVHQVVLTEDEDGMVKVTAELMREFFPKVTYINFGTTSLTSGNIDDYLVSCSQNFVRFGEDGRPLRAWLDCTFQEFIEPAKAGLARPLESPDTTKYRTVHAGDSLWALSAKEYGQPEQWRSIADANRLSNPRLLRSGERLVLPALKKEK